MNLVGIMPARNEEWILGLSLRAALMWCDSVVVLNHASTDGTGKILEQLAAETPGRVVFTYSSDTEWEEMKHRQSLLTIARQYGATHIAMIDADEVLTGNLLYTIRGLIAAAPKSVTVQLPWRCLRGSIHSYYSRGVWAMQNVSMAFMDDPRCHWAARDGYDFHHREPMGRPLVAQIVGREGGLMHLQFISERRLRAKQALYKMTEVLRWPGREPVEVVDRRYNLAVYGQDRPTIATSFSSDMSACPACWWEPYGSILKYLDEAAEPWQEAKVRSLMYEYGPQRFAGLDLFGVV